MQKFQNFEELFQNWLTLPSDAFLYISKSDGDIFTSTFAVIPQDEIDEEVETEDDIVPKEIYEMGMRSFIEVSTFKDIIDVYSHKHPLLDVQGCLKALIHYLKHDDFLE
ncbi:MAG: hypothetical protein JNJ90_16140 [Saprospiraceae bacterium]|jgi:hypothetical protein|nr:hypothetical protein [Saprospiraceae bacterium]